MTGAISSILVLFFLLSFQRSAQTGGQFSQVERTQQYTNLIFFPMFIFSSFWYATLIKSFWNILLCYKTEPKDDSGHFLFCPLKYLEHPLVSRDLEIPWAFDILWHVIKYINIILYVKMIIVHNFVFSIFYFKIISNLKVTRVRIAQRIPIQFADFLNKLPHVLYHIFCLCLYLSVSLCPSSVPARALSLSL